jgi:hypothetical protein
MTMAIVQLSPKVKSSAKVVASLLLLALFFFFGVKIGEREPTVEQTVEVVTEELPIILGEDAPASETP